MVDITAVIAILSVFVFFPALIIGGGLVGKWLKLKNAELEVRRAELEVERQKIEFLADEAHRDSLDRS